jgi:hypothetical protein
MSATRPRHDVTSESEVFLGRKNERSRLSDAIRKRESLLIWVLSDSGKTALVGQALSELPGRIAKRCIYTRGAGSPQDILRGIVRGFAEDPLFRSKFRAETGHGASFAHWVKEQTSLRLRGLLYRAAGSGEYWIFLEDLAPMTHILTRIVKELMINQETPIYSVAPGWTHRELGHGAQLYWNDQQRLHVGPLPLAEANRLLDWWDAPDQCSLTRRLLWLYASYHYRCSPQRLSSRSRAAPRATSISSPPSVGRRISMSLFAKANPS